MKRSVRWLLAFALVSAVEAKLPNADQAFATMSTLAGDSSYGFEMIPIKK